MARRSVRKRRHHRPYEEWKHPSPMDRLVAAMKAIDGRYPEAHYASSRQFGMTLASAKGGSDGTAK